MHGEVKFIVLFSLLSIYRLKINLYSFEEWQAVRLDLDLTVYSILTPRQGANGGVAHTLTRITASYLGISERYSSHIY